MNISTEDIINSTKINEYTPLNHHISLYKDYKNNTIEWCGSDNEHNFNKNLKENYDILKKYGWVDKKVIYKFNSDGYRCPEFTSTGGIAFFGCSFTLGEGVPVENTWTYLVSSKIKTPYYNFGVSGNSADTCVRQALYYLPKLNPSIVVFLYPPDDRIEYIKDGYPYSMMASQVRDKHLKDFEIEYYKRWASSDDNRTLLRVKNLFAMKELCRIVGARFIFKDNSEFKHVDPARDIHHHGVLSHEIFADQIFNTIINNE
jgi:hypothetical protein